MINSSIFTYLPPREHSPDRAFLGFSKPEQEVEDIQQTWIDITSTIEKKVFSAIRKKFDLCSSYLDCIGFAWDNTEVGIVLKKLTPKTNLLSEKFIEHSDQIQQNLKDTNQDQLDKRISNVSLRTLEAKDRNSSTLNTSDSRNEEELNEFAVKTICEMSIQAGIDKQRVLHQIQQAKKEGYLSQKSFNNLQRVLFFA